MHSASLLADAGHSLSGACCRFAVEYAQTHRATSSFSAGSYLENHPLKDTHMALPSSKRSERRRSPFFLIGGALGIGFHSYHLLMEALSDTVSTLPPGHLHDVLQQAASVGHHVPSVGHAHAHVDVLDPNAAWLVALSVFIKEWLYRVTKKVADEEHSPVLYANALHHRSDAYSSFVALFAILGSSLFPTLPLDPLGGTFRRSVKTAARSLMYY